MSNSITAITQQKDYSFVFGTVTETSLALINTCLESHKDCGGTYVWYATSFTGNVVTLTKRYIRVVKGLVEYLN